MPATSLLQVAALLVSCHAGAHLDWQLAGRGQVRGGLINTPSQRLSSGTSSLTQPNVVNFSASLMPSAQLHGTFADEQDLLVRYQPRLYDSLRYTPAGGGAPSQADWTGFAAMHRVLLTYRAGNERQLAFNTQLNFQVGRQDVGDPENLDQTDLGNVSDAGLLPGRLGTLFNYTNLMGIFALKHRPSRYLRISTQETLGLMQYRTGQSLGYFAAMPNLRGGTGAGLETQFRLYVRTELEYLLDSRSSLFADLDLTNVSYHQTASFPAFNPSVGYGTSYAGPGRLKVQAGFLKYWVNPLPGIYERPGYFPTLNLTLSQTFSQIGLPKLTANVLLGLAPYYNILFGNLEPRSTVTVQLNYALTRELSLMGTFRGLSSKYHNLRRWNTLQRGHQRNYILASVAMRYNWRNLLDFNFSVYGSTQSYQYSATVPYTQMRSVYVITSLQGTWQRR